MMSQVGTVREFVCIKTPNAAKTWCLKGKNGSKTEFHKNGLLATLGSNFQEGQN